MGKHAPRKLGPDEEPEEDPVGAFLGRLQEDIERQRQELPHKFREKKLPGDPIVLAAGKPSFRLV